MMRSRISDRCGSANTPSIPNIARPAPVLVSRPCWCRYKATPLVWMSPSVSLPTRQAWRCEGSSRALRSLVVRSRIKAEGDIERSKANLRLYDRLTRAMRSRLKAGLWGVNTKTGGERFYRDLRISAGAIDEFRAGRELAPEAGDGFVRFEYREGEASDVKAD